jgi:hypothetical protein
MEYELNNILANRKPTLTTDVDLMSDQQLEAEIKKEIDEDYE